MIHKYLFSIVRRFYPRCLSGMASIILLFIVISPGTSPGEEKEVVDKIVAVVNDEIIVLQDLDKLIKPMKYEILHAGYSKEQIDSMLSKMRNQAINQLIDEKLIQQASIEYKLTIEPKEVDEAVNRIKEANNFTDEQLEEALGSENMDMEMLRSQLKEQILASKLEKIEVSSGIVITKEDVEEYYNQNADKYQGEKTYHLRNILIKAPLTDSEADRKAVDDKIGLVLSEIKAGKPFDGIARQYSESPFADDGGELGKFRLNDLSPNLRAAVEPLSPGEATAALETSEGYQILYVQEIIQKPATPLDSVYDEIERKLYDEQYEKKKKAWTERLRKNAHIKIIE